MFWFAFAYGISLSVLVVFVLWTILDCAFRWIPYIVGRDLRFEFFTHAFVRELHAWSVHGPRLLLAAMLALLGLTSTGTVVARLFLGTPDERSIRCILLAVVLAAFWLAFFMLWHTLWWWIFRYRIRRRLKALKAAADILSREWPVERIDLPGLASYEVSDRDLNHLLFIEGPCPTDLTCFSEMFDRIGRDESGGLSFAVGTNTGWWVQSLKQGRVPKSGTQRIMDFTVTSTLDYTLQLDEGWYLVHYDISVEHDEALDPAGETA